MWISFANAASRAIYPELVIGRTFMEQGNNLQLFRIDGVPFAEGEAPSSRALRGIRVIEEEWRVRHRDGREIEVQGSAVPVIGAGERLIGVVLTVRDVTEQRRLQREIELQNDRMVEVFRQAPAAIGVTRGPAHTFVTANPLLRVIVGATRSLEGMPIREALPELEGQGFFELLDRVYATGEPFLGNELLARFDRGAGFFEDGYFNFVYQPLRNSSGVVDGVMIHAVDVSDQVLARKEVERKAEELARLTHALEASNSELDQFAYVASHDLKAPLRGIANLTQWIQEDTGDSLSAESMEHMQLLQGRVHRMEALIDGILTYSRAGRVRTQPEQVDTGALEWNARMFELFGLAPDQAPKTFADVYGEDFITATW